MDNLTPEQIEDLRLSVDFRMAAPTKGMIHKLACVLHDKNITIREKMEHWEKLNERFDKWTVGSVIKDLDTLITIRTKL